MDTDSDDPERAAVTRNTAAADTPSTKTSSATWAQLRLVLGPIAS